MCKEPVIAWDKIWTAGKMFQHLPGPMLNQILHSVGDEVLQCPGAK